MALIPKTNPFLKQLFLYVANNLEDELEWMVDDLASAPAFASHVAALPGTSKVVLAHSLGNMLVSSAAVDHNLQYSRYYMLNAAVPMEAYDGADGA